MNGLMFLEVTLILNSLLISLAKARLALLPRMSYFPKLFAEGVTRLDTTLNLETGAAVRQELVNHRDVDTFQNMIGELFEQPDSSCVHQPLNGSR